MRSYYLSVSRKWLSVILLLLSLFFVGNEWISNAIQKGTNQSQPILQNHLSAFAPIPLVDRSKPPSSLDSVPHKALRPLVGEQVLAHKMSRDVSDLPVVTYPDGRRSLSLDGRFMMMSAVVTGPDGKSKVQCFSNIETMKTALANKVNANGHPSALSHASY